MRAPPERQRQYTSSSLHATGCGSNGRSVDRALKNVRLGCPLVPLPSCRRSAVPTACIRPCPGDPLCPRQPSAATGATNHVVVSHIQNPRAQRPVRESPHPNCPRSTGLSVSLISNTTFTGVSHISSSQGACALHRGGHGMPHSPRGPRGSVQLRGACCRGPWSVPVAVMGWTCSCMAWQGGAGV